MSKNDDLIGDLMVYEELLRDAEERMEKLEDPDYDPAQNPDDEFRVSDIDDLRQTIIQTRRNIARIRRDLGLDDEQPK